MGIRTRASNEWDRRARRLQPGNDKPVSDRELAEFTDKAADNLPFFGKYFCYREHSPAQRKFGWYLKYEKKAVGVFSRQTGKTTIIGDYDAQELVFKEYPDGHTDFTMIFAPVQEQAQLIFDTVDKVMHGNDFLISQIAEYKKGGYIRTVSGNELKAKTASPNANIRGFSPTKIQLDETQDISDVKYYEDILPSGATTDAKVQEIGTPAKRNHFWKTFYHDNSYKKVIQPWDQCPFITKRYVMEMKEKMSRARFDQEFNCIWNLDVGSAWPYELIQKMHILEEKNYGIVSGGKYFAGIDVGKHPAETVLSVGILEGNILKQIKLIRVNNARDYNVILKKIYPALAMYEPITCIDATAGSQGAVFFDMIDEKFRQDKNFRMAYKLIAEDYHGSKFKQELVNDVDVLGENNRLKLLNNNGQKRQFISYEKKESAAGNTTYYSDELSDVVQAVSLMVRAYMKHGAMLNQQFPFMVGKTKSGPPDMDGFSFAQQLPKDRPEW